jgi:hypothetical protein
MVDWKIIDASNLSYNAQYSPYDRAKRKENNQKIIKYLNLDKGKPKHILDLGTGCGDLARELLDMGHSVIATNGYGDWASQYIYGELETKFCNIKIHSFTYNWREAGGSITETTHSTGGYWGDNNKELEKLKSYSNKKYDIVIAKRFSMHLSENADNKVLANGAGLKPDIVHPVISEDIIYDAYIGLAKFLKQVCKPNATAYISIMPGFSTHDGYGSPKLSKYGTNDSYKVNGMGQKLLKFNLKTIK